jgi:hypothetical protein
VFCRGRLSLSQGKRLLVLRKASPPALSIASTACSQAHSCYPQVLPDRENTTALLPSPSPLTPCITLPHHNNMTVFARTLWPRPFRENDRYRAEMSAQNFFHEIAGALGWQSGMYPGSAATKTRGRPGSRQILAASRKASKRPEFCSWGSRDLRVWAYAWNR